MRFRVTVEREVIVYAGSKEEAEQVAIRHFLSLEPQSKDTMKVVDVAELPPVEKEAYAPIIDRAPARETRT